MSFALRAITRFQCIGPTCEDSCCSRFQPTLTPEEQQRLETALGPQVRSTFAPIPGSSDVLLRKNAASDCGFLTPQRWCHIHATVGEAAIPDMCAMFPRIVRGQGADRIALGHLGCPELARLALLAEDGLDEVPLPDPFPVRERSVMVSLQRSKEVPYAWFAPEVLPVLLQPWHGEPLASALERVLVLGERLSPFFFHGTDAFAGDWEGAEARLQRALAAGSDEVHSGDDVLRGQGLDRVLRLLERRLAAGGPERMQQVLRPALDRWGNGAARTSEILEELDAVDRGLSDFTSPIRAFRNFARAYTYQGHYTFHYDVLTFAQQLALRMACARVLLFGVATRRWPAEADRPEQERWLDAALVEVFQVLAKYLDQHATTFDAGLELTSGSPEERLARGRELAALLGAAR